jgi:hypothetical protein
VRLATEQLVCVLLAVPEDSAEVLALMDRVEALFDLPGSVRFSSTAAPA